MVTVDANILTISLVILFLPLLGFVIQLVAGKTKTAAEYVVDPHENPAHDLSLHENPADARTADHTQAAIDLPHEHVAHGSIDTPGVHYEYVVTKQRGLWSDSDQKRA